MSRVLRSALSEKIGHCLRACRLEVPASNSLNSAMRIKASDASENMTIHVPMSDLIGHLPDWKYRMSVIGSEFVRHFETDDRVNGVSLCPPGTRNPQATFHIDSHYFAKSFLCEVLTSNENRYVSDNFLSLTKERIVIEFSSPNIAKPFHVGHLKSTMLGNFLANILTAVGHKVTRLNYLGDWGTQFGFLQFGLDQNWYTKEEIASDPIRLLLAIYIKANQMADENPDVATEARHLFSMMEAGDERILRDWAVIRQHTVEELKHVYSRLGVHFDEFHWESMYGLKTIESVIECVQQSGKLVRMVDGRQAIALDKGKCITLVKSDGSTLYLTRDLAAAMDRHDKYGFDRLLYAVDNAQTDHFVVLKQVLQLIDKPYGDRLQHVKFGRIKGMSTRKGTSIHLKDVLDEAHSRMKMKQMQSSTTKVDVETDAGVTDNLAVSALIVHDLKQRRQRDYAFNWDDALQSKGDTGIRLQYTHCRLCSLEEMCGVLLPADFDDIDISVIIEPHMVHLLRDLARFRQIVQDSHDQLEPCILVRYLFDLSHSVSTALKFVAVKNQPLHIAQARLAVFVASKRLLGIGLRMLGIRPLEKM